MVLKFLIAGVISAILAGAAIFLLLDDATVDRIRAERERLVMPELRPERSSDPSGVTSPGLVDRLLGRDEAITAQDLADRTDEARTQHGLSEDSRVGKRLPDASDRDQNDADRDAVADTEPDKGMRSRGPTSDTFEILLDQAKLISIDDARDDAYLSILDLALAQDQVSVADQIVTRLSAPPLRDTARQRIGVTHAQAGRIDAAFAVLDGIEIPELADPIRLEIIRTITDPAP
jgi:hypothetical protein